MILDRYLGTYSDPNPKAKNKKGGNQNMQFNTIQYDGAFASHCHDDDDDDDDDKVTVLL